MTRPAVSLYMLLATTLPVHASCRGLLVPGCVDESGPVFHVDGRVPAGETITYSVVSPKSSNLIMRLTWPDSAAILAMRATITDCGGHTSCMMLTTVPPFGPGGSSPVPQPWPPGLREMLVDGWQGKTYRVDVTGDPSRDGDFALAVSYRITCER